MAAVAAGAFFLALDPVSDGDIFWHLAAGQKIVRDLAWLRTDPFTVSAAGRPWTDVHWLFQLAAFASFQAGGLAGVVVAKAIAVALGAVILVRAVGRAQATLGMVMCAIVLLATLFLGRHLLLARPVVVSLVMLSLTFFALEASRAGTSRWLLALPFTQVVWANCQGGLAVLGPILIACYLCAAVAVRFMPASRWPFASEGALSISSLAGILGLCLLGLLATPYGWEGLLLPGRLFARVIPGTGSVFSAEVAENAPAWVAAQADASAAVYLPWVLAIAAVAVFFARGGVALSRLLVGAGFAALALMATRNVLLFYWLVPPIFALEAAPAVRRWWTASGRDVPRLGARWARILVGVTAAALLLSELALAGVAAAGEGTIAEPVPFHFPTQSAQHLRTLGATGTVFAPDHHGGYLEWTVPEVRPYIDTRLVLHTEAEYAAYLAVVDDPAKFDALADAEGFAYVVLTTSYPDRYLSLAQYLRAHASWRVIYTDGSEILFARAGTATAIGSRSTTEEILRELAARFRRAPARYDVARMNFARLLVVWGESTEAQAVLATLHSRAATQMRARAHFAAGEVAAAEGLARALLQSDERDVRSLALLAQIAVVRGDGSTGALWLRRALVEAPYDPEALTLLRQLETRPAAHPPFLRTP